MGFATIKGRGALIRFIEMSAKSYYRVLNFSVVFGVVSSFGKLKYFFKVLCE